MKKILLFAILAIFTFAPIDAQRVKSLREIQSTAQKKKSSTASGYSIPSCEFTWLSQRYIDYSDIEYLDGSDLRILRNAIFAMHGYIFQSADLRNYFKRYWWYKPRYSNVQKYLNKYERYNIKFIRSYE